MRHRQIGPSGRTLILLALGLLAGSMLTATVVVSLRGPDSAATALQRKLRPAAASLEDAQAASVRAQSALQRALRSSAAVARAASIAEAQRAGGEFDASWREHVQHAPSTADARRLQHSLERAMHESRVAGAGLVSLDPTDPSFESLLRVEIAAFDEQQLIFTKIESTSLNGQTRMRIAEIVDGLEATRNNLALGAGLSTGLFAIAGSSLLLNARRDERLRAVEAAALSTASARAEFETSLQRGLELEQDEASIYEVLEQALTSFVPDVPTELLIADSSQAHFRQVVSTDPSGDAACRVVSPGDCPATTSGQSRFFADSRRLDTCPFLRGHEVAVWALCVPVSVAGRMAGVLRAQDGTGVPPPLDLADRIDLIGRKASERIGMLRVLARSEAQACVDALTGLSNRRTLENRAHELLTHDERFVVAFADLDHFKKINDTHGHEMGDRALRLFARVLRDSVRPRDLPARFGGEEFVIVLPECSLAEAGEVADRIRSRLATVLEHVSIPTFTVSVGLATADPGEAFSEVVARADAAMLAAKAAGRDRVVVSGADRLVDPTPSEPSRASPPMVAGPGAHLEAEEIRA